MTQYIITGAGGFIGSNLARELNKAGFNDLILVDNFHKRAKVENILDLQFNKILSPSQFISLIESKSSDLNLENAKCVHLGAKSSTTYWNLDKLNLTNIEYTKRLINCCIDLSIDIIYASSASVYGNKSSQAATPANRPSPSNAYALSKAIVDDYFYSYLSPLLRTSTSRVWGLRFFNVYGPGEYHKLGQSSPILTFFNQALQNNEIKLFSRLDNPILAGEYRRDFVHVFDCCRVIRWLLDKRPTSDILNVGSGQVTTFLSIAQLMLDHPYFKQARSFLSITPFPKSLVGAYQAYTCSDNAYLKDNNYPYVPIEISQGVYSYIDTLLNHSPLAR